MSDLKIDAHTKGFPHASEPLALSDIGRQGWNVLREDLPLPIAVLRESSLASNASWMRDFLETSGASIAPHGKTTMSPELFRRQLEDGAWAITVANAQQMRVARLAGAKRILIANLLIGRLDIDYVLEELQRDSALEVYTLADSVDVVKRLADGAARIELREGHINVLVEIGYAGGRTGCRDLESALVVARAVKNAGAGLVLAGVEGFEGLHQGAPNALEEVEKFLRTMADAAIYMDGEGLFGGKNIVLTAGGSSYYDVVASILGRVSLSKPTLVVVRSGCYITHDVGTYKDRLVDILERSDVARHIHERPRNALEVWCYVLSVPEKGRAILGAGRRDFGHDSGPPVPVKHFRPGEDKHPRALAAGGEIVGINDQHAHLSFSKENDYRVGDMIALGVSHPCTTFDKWRVLYLVNDAYTVTSAIETFF